MILGKVSEELGKLTKVLFLVKLNDNYGFYSGNEKSGLRNSARFVNDAINKFTTVLSNIDYCIDGNDIDNKLVKYRPDICIIEAIWVIPAKFIELSKLHPNVKFIIRVHSKIPFLAMEGMAFDWIKQYQLNKSIEVSFNNIDTSNSFKYIDIKNTYLPNIYLDFDEVKKCGIIDKVAHYFDESKYDNIKKDVYKIGCFGAIRPFKNHMNQAIAAITFADLEEAKLEFYVNGSRTEQNGGNVLKNLRALFKDTKHELIEVPWLKHEDFLNIVGDMDVCLQVSYTESFNIVTADSIYMQVPTVVSNEINWVKNHVANPNDTKQITQEIFHALVHKNISVKDNLRSLYEYNQKSINIWREYLEKY